MLLLLHEVHEVWPDRASEFEALMRDEWMPALASMPDVRLLWYWDHAAISSRPGNVVTLTAVAGAAAWERLLGSIEGGPLTPLVARLDDARVNVTGNLLLPSKWSELKEVDFGGVRADPKQRGARSVYVEDTVWPWVHDDYIEYAGEHWYKPAVDGTGKVRARIKMPGFFQTAHGTGKRPEVYLLQKLVDPPQAFVRNLLGTDYPPEMKAPEHYFVRGLKVRDNWESKILRTAPWSPWD
jgi:hypothetical protein